MVPARWRSTPWLTRKVSSMLRTGLRLSNLDIFFLGLTSTSMLPVALPGPWRLRLGLSRMLETCTDPRHVTIDTSCIIYSSIARLPAPATISILCCTAGRVL